MRAQPASERDMESLLLFQLQRHVANRIRFDKIQRFVGAGAVSVEP
jgi:hypothetical protein